MLSSLEIVNAGAFVLFLAWAALGRCTGSDASDLPGSKNMANQQLGFPRNLGVPVVSVGTRIGAGWPNRNSPGLRVLRSGFGGAKVGRTNGTAKRRKPSGAAWAAGRRSA